MCADLQYEINIHNSAHDCLVVTSAGPKIVPSSGTRCHSVAMPSVPCEGKTGLFCEVLSSLL